MTRPRASSACVAWLAIAGVAAGCATGASFDGGVYRDGPIAFQLSPLPASWRPIHVSDADLVFRDDAHEASILVNGKCIHENEDAPLTALTEHLIMGTTERAFTTEETVPFDAREARHSVLQAKLDGVVMAYDVFVMKKNGCVYDLVYVGDPGQLAAGAPAFEQFARGFRTVGGRE